MSSIQIGRVRTNQRFGWRQACRWVVTFVGYPFGGYLAWLIVGPVDNPASAVFGGLLSGVVLGAVQSWGMRADREVLLRWTATTAVGFAVGLGVGAGIVDYETTLGALVAQGLITGFAIGLAQLFVLGGWLGRLALAWPPFLAALWGIGWAITTSAGIGVDEQFTVFGSSGAVVVALLTVVLPIAVDQRPNVQSVDER